MLLATANHLGAGGKRSPVEPEDSPRTSTTLSALNLTLYALKPFPPAEAIDCASSGEMFSRLTVFPNGKNTFFGILLFLQCPIEILQPKHCKLVGV